MYLDGPAGIYSGGAAGVTELRANVRSGNLCVGGDRELSLATRLTPEASPVT